MKMRLVPNCEDSIGNVQQIGKLLVIELKYDYLSQNDTWCYLKNDFWPEPYLESNQASTQSFFFAKICNSFQLLTLFTKNVLQGSEYASGAFFCFRNNTSNRLLKFQQLI